MPDLLKGRIDEMCEMFKRFSNSRLTEYLRNLESLIESDLIRDCILCDEIIKLYELMLDECARRIACLGDISAVGDCSNLGLSA